MKAVKTALFASLLAGATAFAQMPAEPQNTKWPEFRTLDTNGDGQLSKDEASVNPVVAQHFDALDSDKNGMLSVAEYEKGKQKKPTEEQKS